MKNLGSFKALCLGFVLLLAGCAELQEKETSHVTTCEALDMEFDSTTRSEAEYILKSYGYSVKTKTSEVSKKLKTKKRYKKLPKSTFSFLDGVTDKLSTLEVQVPKNNEWMKFLFDKDQKLIGFSAKGNRKILDPLIANDNKNRDVLINLSSNSINKAHRKKAKDLLSKYIESQAVNKKKSKKASSKKGKENWDTTIYLGKDLSIAANVHTDEYKDSSFYSVTSPGAIHQIILMIRDLIKTMTENKQKRIAEICA